MLFSVCGLSVSFHIFEYVLFVLGVRFFRLSTGAAAFVAVFGGFLFYNSATVHLPSKFLFQIIFQFRFLFPFLNSFFASVFSHSFNSILFPCLFPRSGFPLFFPHGFFILPNKKTAALQNFLQNACKKGVDNK